MLKCCPKCKSFAVAEYDQSHICNKPTFNIKCKACGYIETASSKEELADIVNKNWVIDYEGKSYKPSGQMIAEGDCDGNCIQCEGKEICWNGKERT